MSSCEKCWRDSGGNATEYARLVASRTCKPEEQAGGEDAKICPACKRKTVHVYTGFCMNPECT